MNNKDYIASVAAKSGYSLEDTQKIVKSVLAAMGSSFEDGNAVQVTATEKKLLELYRAADSDKKKAVMSLLKGETQTASEMLSSLLDGSKKPDEILTSLFSGSSSGSNSNSKKTDDIVSSLLGACMNSKK